MTKVFIDGAEGTTGLKIARRLADRHDIRLIGIEESLRKDPKARRERYRQADIVILCLPDDAAREAICLAQDLDVRLIDASTAHRTEPGWAYGFPELSPEHRTAILHGDRVAVPGCHASGFVALVYPLVSAGLLSRDASLVCHSVTGYSGGGKKMIAQYEDAHRDSSYDSPRQYALGQQHKHLKEMTRIPGLQYEPAFSPIVADFYSGMAVTLPLFSRNLTGHPTRERVAEIYAQWYRDQKLVHALPCGTPDGMIAANAMSGLDSMQIVVMGNDERILPVALFDNLGKGASGAAIQCLNLMTGAPEETGLVLKSV